MGPARERPWWQLGGRYVLGPVGTERSYRGSVPGGEGRCGDAVRHHAQDDREGDGRQDSIGVGRVERVEGQQREDDRGESARAEPPDEQHGAAIEPETHARHRHGHHAHDGEGHYGEHDVLPFGGLNRRYEQRGTDQVPHQEGHHLADDVRELDRGLELGWDHAAEGHARDEGGDEPVGSDLDGAGVCQERRRPTPSTGERRVRCTRGRRPTASARRRRDRCRCPCPAPPTRSTTAAPTLAAPWMASVVAAPARKIPTNGVAMPSFSPLSTLSTRRMRPGTRESCMMAAPRAASVGATEAAITATTHHPLPR